jgi:beta-lactamase superfamily II metal-dependent hydrolase
MRTAWQALTISVIAWLAAAPLVALHFEQFHPLGWLCSWLLIPLATLSTMLGFLKLGLTAIAGEHSQLLAPLCMWMTRAFVTQVHWLAQLPGVELNCPCPSAGLLLVTLAALATLLLHSHARTITLLTLAAQAVVVATTANSVGSGPALVALPGDRGFSAFVRSSDGSATALDPGPALGCGSSAKLRRGLAQLGVYKVRTIVITSVERDRMSGILALLDAWPDARVWITGHFERAAPPGSSADQVLDSLAHRGIVPMRLFAGQTVKEEAIQTTVWGPPVTLESGVSHRAASLTLELRVGRHRVAVYGPSERRAHHPEIAGPPDVDAIVVLDNQPEVPGAHGCPMALRWCVPDETVGARDLNEVVVTNRALIVPIIDRRPPSPPYAAGSTSRTPESARGAPGMYR